MKPHLSRGAWALLSNAAAIYMAALATGADWLFVLVSALLAILVVGALWPFVLLRRGLAAEAFIISGPVVATAGDPVEFTVQSNGPNAVRLRPAEGDHPWAVPTPKRDGRTTDSAWRRGVYGSLVIEFASSAPLGIVSWRTKRRHLLESPLEVGPRPENVGRAALDALTDDSQLPRSVRVLDHVRGLRDYRHQDPMRHVHWPASARRDVLMVKEFEGPERQELTLSVDLGGGGEAGERIAERAAGLAELALRDGVAVRLLTCERDGTSGGSVSTPREVGQRLARCVPGRPAAVTNGVSGQIVRLAP